MFRNLFILALFVIASCNFSTHESTITNENLAVTDSTEKDREVIEPISIDTVLIGDLNSDRVLDTAFITTPAMIKHLDENNNLKFYGDCLNGECYNRINFSNGLSEIYNDNSI